MVGLGQGAGGHTGVREALQQGIPAGAQAIDPQVEGRHRVASQGEGLGPLRRQPVEQPGGEPGGRERRTARAAAGSAGSASPSQGSWWGPVPAGRSRRRSRERSRPFTTGASLARPARLASATVVLTAAAAGTRSLNRSW